VELHHFRDSAAFARRLARALGVPLRPIRIHRFPDGESRVEVTPRPAPDAILLRQIHDPNAKLLELVLAADALRRAGVRRLTLVAPYLPYMRQDRVFEAGQPHSQSVVGRLLGTAFDRVLTVEAHLHRTPRLRDVLPCPATSLSAAPAFADWVRSRRGSVVLIGPDQESEVWVRRLARACRVPWYVGHKERLGDRRVRIRFPDLPVVSKAILVDDIVSSGSTLAVAARALRARGIPRIEALAVHALVTPSGLTRMRAAGIAALRSCDTVPHPTNRFRVASLLAARLARRR
jgi:ribose-phosphate pyrophosphokinase